MFYLISPAGTPISLTDLVKTVFMRGRPARGFDLFTEQVKKHSRTKHCFLVNSGRCAQTLILKALKKTAPEDKDEIVIPAYTCYSVPASIVRAGLKIRPVDIDPATMDYDYEKLRETDFSRVLAVTAANLFGLVSNWTELNSLAGQHGLFLIDDAAQALGASYNDRPAGSFGSAGFYSLDRGKNLSTYAGGVLVSDNDRIAKEITSFYDSLKTPSVVFEISLLVKMFLYGLLLRPRLYWFPSALPFLRLGETVYDDSFKMEKLSRLQIAAGAVLFSRFDKFNAIRRENSRRLAGPLTKDGRYSIPGFATENCPAYLRLPVLAENKSAREKMIQMLGQKGITASTMYPDIVSSIPDIKEHLAIHENDFPGALQVVEKLLTLPTHYYLRKRDIETILNCFKG